MPKKRAEEGAMKNLISRLLVVSTAAMVLTASSGPAQAGSKNPYTVFIQSTFANGTLAGANRSANTVEYIGCYSYRTTGASATTLGYCFAKDSFGTTRSCSTSDIGAIDTIRSINPSSYIEFGFSTNGAACSYVYVENSSPYL
jgi:hypothetical protein